MRLIEGGDSRDGIPVDVWKSLCHTYGCVGMLDKRSNLVVRVASLPMTSYCVAPEELWLKRK